MRSPTFGIVKRSIVLAFVFLCTACGGGGGGSSGAVPSPGNASQPPPPATGSSSGPTMLADTTGRVGLFQEFDRQTNHPDWILYACDANNAPTHDLAYRSGVDKPDVPLDFHNPGVIDY